MRVVHATLVEFDSWWLLGITMCFPFARVLTCTVLGGIGIFAGLLFARFLRTDSGIPSAASSSVPAELELPDPRLSPADVVRLQVHALRAFRKDPSAILQCYALASPANRAVTGPLDRFIAMVQNPTYGALVAQTGALVGQPVIRGAQATVLVTVLDERRTVRAFRFFLSKQTDLPYLDCWMTDAVIPAAGQPEPNRASAPVSAA